MIRSHAPFPYQRTSSDVDRESRGIFTVRHDKGLDVDSTYNRLELQARDTCSERPLRWLWQDKVPLGKLTLIEGPPAVGKLFVALDIAARVSNGAPCGENDDGLPSSQSDPPPPAPPLKGGREAQAELPADRGEPVILVCDSWQAEDMIAPRLRMLGANRERIIMFTEVNCSDTCWGHRHNRPIRFPLDRPMFEDILRQNRGCRLIVIDNLENYCGSPRELRQAIRELDETAIYFGVAIVATLQGNLRLAPDGAIRDTARTRDGLARCIWCITPDAAHPGLLRLEPKRMAFCKKPEGIAFRISDAGKIVWEPLPPYEKPPTEAARRKHLEHARMLTWLRTTLGTGVVLAETIYDAGKEQGFSKNKLIAARDELSARTFKYGFGGYGAWMWTVKPQADVTDAEIQAAYLTLPHDFPADLKEVLEGSVPGRDGVVDEEDEGDWASPREELENFGVLSKKRGKTGGFRTSGRGRKPSPFYDGLSPEQLRELALGKLGLLRRSEQETPEEEDEHEQRHVGNGQSGNGQPGNGHDLNDRWK